MLVPLDCEMESLQLKTIILIFLKQTLMNFRENFLYFIYIKT